MDLNDIVVPGNVSAFLLKLWKIVEDSKIDHLISWSQNGRTFKVHDQVEFAKQVLPKFYKHNNFSSFVRQVNMYGFRKIIDSTGGGSLKHEKDEWEFYHQYFQQDNMQQLHLIKRKVHAKEETKAITPQFAHLLKDVDRLKEAHDIVREKLDLMKIENKMLWGEVEDLRGRHKSHQNIINKLIQFFVQLVMGKTTDINLKRRALDYPARASKFSRTTQELQPYSGQNTSIGQLLPDTSYSVQSPPSTFDDRLTELSPEAVVVVDEGGVNNIYPNTTMLPVSSVDNGTGHVSNVTDSPFTFPQSYKDKDTPSIYENDTRIQLIPDCPNQSDNDFSILTCVAPCEVSPMQTTDTSTECKTLLTPVVSVPTDTSTETHELLTPVVTVPALISRPASKDPGKLIAPVVRPAIRRQSSFKDRNEIIQDVDKIESSLDVLQDMLEKNQINVDLKSLNMLYNDLPTQVSVQDLLRMIHQDEDNSSDNTQQGQIIPYTTPFSPSQLMDSEYTTSGPTDGTTSDFFDSVLETSSNNSMLE